MIYPESINKDEIIGITATSKGVTSDFDKERLNKAIENLHNLGYKTKITDNVYSNKQFVSSSGQTRAKEFLKLWSDDIKVISQVRGGELLLEMLPYLDDKIIKQNKPKWIFGFSDSSLLEFYITTKFHIATINSSNIFDFAASTIHKSVLSIIDCFNKKEIIQESFKLYEKEKQKERIDYILDTKVKYDSLYKKDVTIKGRIIGGCLEAITEILGTKYDYVEDFTSKYPEGMLWYLDIYDSNPLDLYRRLLQMKWSNWFKNINGIVIGRTRSLKECDDLTYEDVLHKVFDDMNIPVVLDADIGHVMPQFSIINGSFGTFIYKNHKCIFKQEKI
ncbi:MAG: LD-carboxypeptidase [Bacilli bacterium]|nr:LD-carboxypeptidase [Bacilli bacterium]